MMETVANGLHAGLWLFAAGLGAAGCIIIVLAAVTVLHEAIDTIRWHFIMKRRKKH